jgi:hypothetical protein
MAKRDILGFKPPARLEPVRDQDCRGVQDRKHQPSKCDDSTSARESSSGWDFRKAQHNDSTFLI